MRCPFCHHDDTQVMETRDSDTGDFIRRRRRCQHCEQRFTTYERIELALPTVVKSDNSRVDFDRSKLASSMKLALRKRPVSQDLVAQALDRIESALMRAGQREISSQRIGELVMGELQQLDKVAYIRFASVYRNFDDIDAFAQAVTEMQPVPKSRQR